MGHGSSARGEKPGLAHALSRLPGMAPKALLSPPPLLLPSVAGRGRGARKERAEVATIPPQAGSAGTPAYPDPGAECHKLAIPSRVACPPWFGQRTLGQEGHLV